MRRGWFARRVALTAATRSFKALESDAKTFAHRRTRRMLFPRLRFVFFPVGAANFALTEDMQLTIARNCSWPSRLWAHLAPLLCITGALGCAANAYSSVGFDILAAGYFVVTLFVYFILWAEDDVGLFEIIGRRWDVADSYIYQAEKSRQAFLAEDMTPLAVSVGALLDERLANLEDELVGPRSRFHVARAEIVAHLAHAQRLLERQRMRIGQVIGDTPPHLASLHSATKAIVDRYERALKKLDEFCARIGAYLDACRAQVRGLVVEVADMEMAREVSALQRQIAQDEQTATQVVAETLTQLQDGMTALRRDVLARERIACEIAGELPHARDVNVELERLEDVLEGLIPSRTPARVRA